MSLNHMKARLNYCGGSQQQKRMNADKLKGLKQALWHSYQAATAVLSDGREFRCLINPDKLSLDLDNKILSIPFQDYCLNNDIPLDPDSGDSNGKWEDMEDLTAVLQLADNRDSLEIKSNVSNNTIPSQSFSHTEQKIGIKEGDVIQWKENGSYWLVYLQRLEETAYFRADIRRCRHQITLENGNKYWVYIRGPVEQSLVWMQGGGNYINKLNNTLQIYVTQNAETLDYFHRFSKIKLNGNTWEVQAIDSISTPGIIEVALKETSNNTPKDDIDKAVQDSINIVHVDERQEEYIHGPVEVYPYETHIYELKNSTLTGGRWQISNMSRKNAAEIVSFDGLKVTINILTGKSANIQLDFITEEKQISLPIKIKSL